MTSSLAALLEQAGFDTSERGFWQRVVMVHNWGMLPAEQLDEGDVMATRGFNALVLDRAGVPTHFCKCRPPTKAWIQQTALYAQMSRVPALRRIIPRARDVSSRDLHMSITTYVPGRLLASRVSWMRRATLRATLREILEEMETISQHAAVIDPEEDPQVDLAGQSAWAFDAIPLSLLAAENASVLRATVAAAGRVARVPQHGDLWPMNVLRYDHRWLLLDFEIFGRIQVPLYDAFHLVRSCWAMRQGWLQRTAHWLRNPVTSPWAPNWIASLRSASASDPYRQTLAWAQARHGLTNTKAVGALAFYLIDVAARMYLRRLPMVYVEPYLRDLGVLAESLASGETFAAAFCGGASSAPPSHTDRPRVAARDSDTELSSQLLRDSHE
jgi:hypothetical protein